MIAVLGFAVLWIVLPLPAAAVEHAYSRGLYRWIAAVVVPLSSALPFSLSLVAIALGALAFTVVWVRAFGRLRADGASRGRAFGWGLKRLAVLGLWLYAAFVVLWGAGYRRTPIEARLGLAAVEVPAGLPAEFLHELRDTIARSMPADRDRDVARAVQSLSRALQSVVRDWDGVESTLPARVKRIPPGLLLFTGYTGIVSPFLLEPHVDGALPPAYFIAVAAHELAHVAGFCGEADADLAGYAAGLRADDAFARYAVALVLFDRLAARAPSPAEAEAALDGLPPRARLDLDEAHDTIARHVHRSFSRAWSTVYDAYLRTQGVVAGVADYGRALGLVLRARQAGLIAPPLPRPR